MRQNYVFSQENLKNQKNAAIARSMQMFAHDVRAPFTAMRAMMSDIVELQNNPIEIIDYLKSWMPYMQSNIQKVMAMIADLMEIDAPTQNLVTKSINLDDLVLRAMVEQQIVSKDKIKVQYHFMHKDKVDVNPIKIERALSNLISNAVQAMGQNGTLWFSSVNVREHGKSFVQLCVGNSGSFIPEEKIPLLFKEFYTEGKVNGTGLGLAVVEKVIQAHGGKIECKSLKNTEFPTGKVEFFMLLPAADNFDY